MTTMTREAIEHAICRRRTLGENLAVAKAERLRRRRPEHIDQHPTQDGRSTTLCASSGEDRMAHDRR